MSEADRTRTRKNPILLSDGGVESLLCALALEQEFTAGIRLRHLRGEGANAERREDCARHQATLLEVDLDVTEGHGGHPPSILTLTDGLFAAGPDDFIVWPVRCGPDAEAVARQLEMAQHLSRACAIAREQEPLSIDTPMIDLDEVQVLDMIFDMGAPLGAAWPCENGRPTACGACQACSKWREAAKRLGREWPWGELQPVG